MRPGARKVLKLLRIVGDSQYRRGLRYGVAAAIEHRNFFKGRAFGTIIDVGSNRGQFALLARSHNPNADIYCFEPLPSAAKTLRALFARDSRVHVFECALAAQVGRSELNVSNRDDSSSMLPIGTEQTTTFPGTHMLRTQDVEVATLDSCLATASMVSPSLLKLDVQGYELSVLEGAAGRLPSITDIYLEVSYRQLYDGQPLADEVLDWLAVNSFKLSGVYHTSFDSNGVAVQSDIHLTNRRAR